MFLRKYKAGTEVSLTFCSDFISVVRSLFFERFVLFFCLKIERFVPDSAEIWICGLYLLHLLYSDEENKGI
ncbi:hypothetical protein EVA_17186 [gut metagenome]|uniref:Uncharacterized protein n=1 Tax=gut metagenome TaxID=749906 RepID=J9FYT9_9ZZZZ